MAGAIKVEHVPVMKNEIGLGLEIVKNGIYLDCTIGEGGHALHLLQSKNSPKQVLGIDLDKFILKTTKERLENYKDKVCLSHGYFANLKTIIALKDEFKCKVGYSGHEPGVVISLAAVSLGATSLERHITLDRSMYGSDQAASLEPRGLRELVSSVRKIEKSLGTSKVGHVTKEEHEIAKKLRAHIKK